MDQSAIEDFGNSPSVAIPLKLIAQMSKAESLEETVAAVARWIRWTLNADRAAVAMYQGGDHLKLYVIEGNTAVAMDMHLPICGTAVGRVFWTQRPEVWGDANETADTDRAHMAKWGLHSTIVVPLISRGICFGTFNIAHRDQNAFDDADLQKVVAIADWLAANMNIRRQMEQLDTLTRTDPLTGLLNRRALLSAIRNMMSCGHDDFGSYVVAIVDLDHFKVINDTHGHAVGDRALTAAAAALRSSCRSSDIVARIGGEEFCVVLTNITRQQALGVLARFSVCLKREGIRIANVSLTASIGAVCAKGGRHDFEQLMRRADQAMYRAKENGRARIEFGRSALLEVA